MGYPEPTPAVKGKRAREIRDDLARKQPAKSSSRWRGSKKTFETLSKDE